MADQIIALDEADDCRVVILRSEGKVFCAGADFNECDDFAADDDDAAASGLALVADFRIDLNKVALLPTS